MRSTVYDRRALAVQIGSLDLMKINILTSNVNQEETGKTNKITKVITTAQYTSNTEINPSGRD